MKPKLNWIQSTFVENCPLYYVNLFDRPDSDKALLRIEYQTPKWADDQGYWTIEGANIKYKTIPVDVGGDQTNSEAIKLMAEKMLKDSVLDLYIGIKKAGLLEYRELIQKHNEGTRFCSFAGHMRESSPTYNIIIEQGQNIIPDILRYLRDVEHAGMSIILLLEDITHLSPYNPKQISETEFVSYDVMEAKKAWIEWGIQENLI